MTQFLNFPTPKMDQGLNVLKQITYTHGIGCFHLKMIRLSICYIPQNTQLTPHLSFSSLSTGYIGEFEIIDDHRSQKIVVELNGRLNKCGVISPRFDVPVNEVEKWIVNLLPSRQFGHIVLSTTYGIMTHEEAKRKKTGGKVLGFFY